uniref:DNA ligase D polymerase domain-containing protein n=1 Tax=Globodera rostochiensis TaxID=31243 RepID=A0A914HBE8_GLORO
MLYPELELTKKDLAVYYQNVANRMLPLVNDHLLSVVRCPDGRTEGRKGKRNKNHWAKVFLRVCHWACLFDCRDLEHPDRIVMDIDPGEGVTFDHVKSAAVELKERLQSNGLHSLPLLTGGKGVHVVAPLIPKANWDLVHKFTQEIAKQMEEDDPDKYISQSAKAKRKDRIFIDYLRNSRGATAIAPYSTRNQKGAPVAAPVTWDELEKAEGPGEYNVKNMLERVKETDPWQESQKILIIAIGMTSTSHQLLFSLLILFVSLPLVRSRYEDRYNLNMLPWDLRPVQDFIGLWQMDRSSGNFKELPAPNLIDLAINPIPKFGARTVNITHTYFDAGRNVIRSDYGFMPVKNATRRDPRVHVAYLTTSSEGWSMMEQGFFKDGKLILHLKQFLKRSFGAGGAGGNLDIREFERQFELSGFHSMTLKVRAETSFQTESYTAWKIVGNVPPKVLPMGVSGRTGWIIGWMIGCITPGCCCTYEGDEAVAVVQRALGRIVPTVKGEQGRGGGGDELGGGRGKGRKEEEKHKGRGERVGGDVRGGHLSIGMVLLMKLTLSKR